MQGIERALGRYLKIVDDKTVAKFLICKAVKCEPKRELNEMLDEHSKKMKEFRWLDQQDLCPKDLSAEEYSLLDLKIDIAERYIEKCNFCERKCGINRKVNVGFCGVGYKSRVASAFAHYGEEPYFVPSGTIFFSGCNSRCVFCMDGNTVIPLFDGELNFIPIKDLDVYFSREGMKKIEKDFYVITPTGIRKIIGVQRRPIKENLLKIITKRGKAITVTSEHRVMVYDKKNNIIGKMAKEIQPGDKLIMPLKKMKISLPNYTSKINLISKLTEKAPRDLLLNVNVRNAFDVLRKLAKLKGIKGKRICTKMLNLAGVKSKKRNGPISIADFSKVCKMFNPPDDLLNDIKIGTGSSKWTVPALLEITPELMWLLGYFVAEGHYTMHKKKGYGHLGITTKSLDKIAQLISSTMNTWVCKSLVKNKTPQLFFGGKLWYLIFRFVFGIPPKAENKMFPNIFYNADKNLQKAFLSGFLTGDGTVAYNRKSNCFIRFVTTSEVLKSQLSFLLHCYDIEFTIKEHFCHSILPTGHKSKRKQWWITICGWYNIKKFHEIAEFLDERKEKIETFLRTSLPRTNKCRIKNFEKVKEARSVRPSHRFVYDLLIDGKSKLDHTFFAGDGILVHNCQNWHISQNPLAGEVWEPEDISNWIEKKHKTKSIINVNLVGGEPTPNLHNILKALRILNVNIPIIWNSNMYMSEECMEILDGIVDVYLADFKYGNDECAMRLSSLPNYFRIVSRNHLIAKRQCEVLIRHLVMPNHIECCSKKILSWIKEKLGDAVRTNIMSQYRPEYRAYEFKEINRRLYREEYEEVLSYAKKIGLTNIEIQPMY
jgi:uncharacterized Fe-S radical SAM superfamily protein PflX